ncbi:MAG: enoyl-CoA hydratase/isomerase family protein [Pseudomonadota bacterium]
MPTLTSKDGVSILTFDRPPLNAFDYETLQETVEALEALAAAPPASGVVITGANGIFSAGVDVKALPTYDTGKRREVGQLITAVTAHLTAIPTPVVAAVNGHAIGAGFIVILCCDYRIVVDDPKIKLSLPEIAAGLPFPNGPRAVVHHELPSPLRRRLTLMGDAISPPEMAAFNLVDDLAAPDDLMADAIAASKKLSGHAGFTVIKQQIRGPLAKATKDGMENADPYLP